jgi:hypothetical protein
MTIGRLLYVLGLILMFLCVIDVALMRFADIDLTGSRYTSIVLGGGGIILLNVARFMPGPVVNDDEE